MTKGMLRHAVRRAPLAGATALALMAAGTFTSAQAAGPLKSVGKGEGRVDIVAWPGYIERGATDKNFDWVTGF
jgi:putative spermidine/putrescine transport system substrate-binding protein